jgi:superfamily II DNA or RNA helicase
LEALRKIITEELDKSIEMSKKDNPFLTGVPAILEALRSKQIECRVYDKEKFHAKAYITHAKLEVVGSQALVGSSNFTHPGLCQNIELNIQVQSAREVAQLQEWFETHWDLATEVTDDVVGIIERHTREYTPFDVYAKALQEYFRGHELSATEWDETKSKMFPSLDRYQKEAYWSLMKIAKQHGGAFLCDGVGLGKTFVGLMLIERMVLHEGKRVVLLAPKAAKEGVWEPHLKKWLSHIGGVGGAADFSNLAVFAHTDLTRKGDFPSRFKRLAELADIVIVDEAHHFRNTGIKGEGGAEPSRYWKLFDLLDGNVRPKLLFMLTATPINNQLGDFRHMIELFSRGSENEAYFAKTLGVNNLKAHFNKMERALRDLIGSDSAELAAHNAELQALLEKDETFSKLVVQRSRAYAKESQLREKGTSASFPERLPPNVAEYSIRKTYGKLLDLFESSFERTNPLFNLAIYYPLKWYKGPVIGGGQDTSFGGRAFQENQQKQVVGLVRVQFLKRFESSACAFELSLDRLTKKLLAFIEVHSEMNEEIVRFQRWKKENAEVLGLIQSRQLDLWGNAEVDQVDDVVPQEFLDATVKLERNDYDVVAMMEETYADLDRMMEFSTQLRKLRPEDDDKLQSLIKILKSKELRGEKVLIFTEFADTAKYLARQLEIAGIEGVDQVDSGTAENRAVIVRRFSPYYNETTSAKLAEDGQLETRILISTDVLSEGLNLQDASRMINYDIHWNPVRLMQRIGRVDRRMSPEVEKLLLHDHPDQRNNRGKVSFWNFLPPKEINDILSLYSKVTQKALLISKTLGIEGKQFLTPEDDFEALKEFNQTYEGKKTEVEDMHLAYQSLLQLDTGLEARLKAMPSAIFSGRDRLKKGIAGVFLCYSLPALDKEKNEYTEEAGTSRWYLYDFSGDRILEEPKEIIESIRSEKNTIRRCIQEQVALKEIRNKVQGHIKNTYLKRIDAPVGVIPKLKCWMELNER